VLAERRPFPSWLRWLLRVCFALLSLGFAACTLVVDADELDSGCPTGEKRCPRGCVSTQDPAYGCAAARCDQPCPQANATARCASDGTCAIASCSGKYEDCNTDPADGCEVDIAHDPEHCGSCMAAPCEIPHATAGCGGGKCGVAICDPGFRDCDGQARNGCETSVPIGVTVCPSSASR
jgi:hypothetical protein